MSGQPLVVVTATLDRTRTEHLWSSWEKTMTVKRPIVMVEGVMGVVSAFAHGVDLALQRYDPEIIACFHDDLRIDEAGWDERIVDLFAQQQKCGLAGFGGAKGLGCDLIYQKPYEPMDLVRLDFRSNLENAEAHGRRVTEAEQVACLDGFSQIGRAKFFRHIWRELVDLGIKHHAYDSALGATAHRDGWEVWLLPIRCHHHGGLTAILNERYHEWAKPYGGDAQFWKESHEKLYEHLRDVLPLRIR